MFPKDIEKKVSCEGKLKPTIVSQTVNHRAAACFQRKPKTKPPGLCMKFALMCLLLLNYGSGF